MNFWIFFRNILWAIPLEKEAKYDYYGELIIFFLIYPYRLLVAASIISWAVLGIEYVYPLFFIWLLMFIEHLVGCIYSHSPKWQAYEERERLESIKRRKIKQNKKYRHLVNLHRDDPPKLVSKRF